MRCIALLLLVPSLVACSEVERLEARPGDDAGDGDTLPTDGDPGDAPRPSDPDADPPPPPPPPWPTLTENAGIAHLHSPFSHDACDGDGLPGGVPNAACLVDLRAGLCAARIDVASLTDHPSFMRDYPFEQLVHHDASKGDELVRENGAVVANRMRCPDGRRVLLMVGYESTHTMPLALRRHVAPERYGPITNEVATADAQALVRALKDAGAVVAMAHSEEDDLSAANIVASGLDAMEWYNPHGNFKTALGGDNVEGSADVVTGLLDGFTEFADGEAASDLVFLELLAAWPQAGFDKWREVLRSRHITGLLGSDVHQNVSVSPLCDRDNELEQALCVEAARAILPDWLDGLADGGTILLNDGERFDSFARIMRWGQNRVLMATPTPDGFTEALRKGRNYGVFTVFGDARGVMWRARARDGTPLVMGDARPGPLDAELILPAAPTPMPGGAHFSASEAARVEAKVRIFRTHASGTELVREQSGLASPVTLTLSQPGAYHVEVWVKPKHLVTALAGRTDLAERESLWIITNPLRVQ